MDYKRTGVFATDQEIAAVKRARNQHNFDPLAARHGPRKPEGKSPSEVAHAAALAHGLPDVDGFYGVLLDTREFVKWSDPVPVILRDYTGDSVARPGR